MSRGCSVSVFSLGVICAFALSGADWPRFRGPDGSGVSDEKKLPLKWKDDEGVAWKAKLPGPGSSSPITSGQRAFVTSYIGFGVDGGGGDPANLSRALVCVDLKSGNILWERSVKSRHAVARFSPPGVNQHGYASSTPATDGERVFAFFGSSGVVAFDLDGKELWRKDVSEEPGTHFFGTASSPIVYEDVLIVPATVESESFIAFDCATGREAWRVPAAGYACWTTPILVDVEGGGQELVVSVPDEVWGLNPTNGKLRWYAQSSISGGAVCPSVVAHDGVAYAIGGRAGRAIAVKVGGRGDVSESGVAWRKNTGSYVPSPAVYGGHLYWVDDRGTAHCVDLKTGDTVYQKRIEGASGVYASILVAAGRIYAVTRRNGTFVLAAKPEYELLAHNELASDTTDFNASPAVADGRLLLRSNRYLYSIGE